MKNILIMSHAYLYKQFSEKPMKYFKYKLKYLQFKNIKNIFNIFNKN